MSNPPGDLQTIDEYLLLIDLEPGLQDVFVEGRTDAALVRQALSLAELDAQVYAISDRLYVPREEVGMLSLDYGERDKLITLAFHLETRSAATETRVVLVVDADWNEATGPIPIKRRHIVFTDGPSLEWYVVDPPNLAQFVEVGLRRPNGSAHEFIQAVRSPLRQIAAARLALKDLGVAISDKFPECCDLTPGRSTADIAEIIRRSVSSVHPPLDPGGRASVVERALGYQELLDLADFPGRPKDLVPLAIAFFNLSSNLRVPDTVHRLLVASIAPSTIVASPAFGEVQRRLAA